MPDAAGTHSRIGSHATVRRTPIGQGRAGVEGGGLRSYGGDRGSLEVGVCYTGCRKPCCCERRPAATYHGFFASEGERGAVRCSVPLLGCSWCGWVWVVRVTAEWAVLWG